MATKSTSQARATRGPLTVHARNPRYFADADGRAVLLAGSHTWATLQECGPVDPPDTFDWDGYLDFMVEHGHNFMRLWTWENSKWGSWWDGDYFFYPMAWARTGPGAARDGKPKFDLEKFDDDWFARLHARVGDARDHGIYVAVMLFQGWSGGNKPFDAWTVDQDIRQGPNPWHGHPFKQENNVNGIDASAPGGEGDEWVHTLRFPDVVALQESYVRRVIDTVNEYDNVMYEIGNEHDGGSENTAWQYHMVNVVHNYEREHKSVAHPVLMTSQWPQPDNAVLFASPAEAVSPCHWHRSGTARWQQEPPAEYLGKVIVCDTDHLWGVGGTYDWVWRTVMRGHNVLYMDPYGYIHMEPRGPDGDSSARRAMGRALSLSRTVDLGELDPRPELTSTGFALASPGREYVVYQPDPEGFWLDLTNMPGPVQLRWLHPVDDVELPGGEAVGGEVRRMQLPSASAWIAHITAA